MWKEKGESLVCGDRKRAFLLLVPFLVVVVVVLSGGQDASKLW